MKKIISIVLVIVVTITIFPALFITNANASTIVEKKFKVSEFSREEDTDWGMYWLDTSDRVLGIDIKITSEGNINIDDGRLNIEASACPVILDIVSSKYDIAYFIFNSIAYNNSLRIDCEIGKTQRCSFYSKGLLITTEDGKAEGCDEIIVGYVDETKNTLNVKSTDGDISILKIEDIDCIKGERGERTAYVHAPDVAGPEITAKNVNFTVPSSDGCYAYDWLFNSNDARGTVTISVPNGSFITKVKINTMWPNSVLKCEYGMFSSNNDPYDDENYGWQEISFDREDRVDTLNVTCDKYQRGTEVYVEYYDVEPWMSINFKDGTTKAFFCGDIEKIETNLEDDFYMTRVEATDNGTTYTAPIKNFYMTTGIDDRNNDFYIFNTGKGTYDLGVKNTTIIFTHDHELTKFLYSDNATCTTNRIDYYRCICGATVSNEVENTALGHDNITIVTNLVIPTCTEKGGYDNTRLCMRCGKKEFINHVDMRAYGHNIIEVTNPATCITDGSIERYCLDCDFTEAITIEKTGHINTYWTVAKEATEDEEGLKVKKCACCNETLEEETIARIQKTEPETESTTTADEAATNAPTEEKGRNPFLDFIRMIINAILKLFGR